MPPRSHLLPLLCCILAGCFHGEELGSGEKLTPLEQEAAPRDWPRWRGPRVDGISRETGWLALWPDDGPRQIWKINVGTGFSSVSVAAGRLYTMGNRGGEDLVYCLDAATGKEIWRHRYACPLTNNQYEGGPNATPTVDGEHVYTFSKEGHLYCLDAKTGDVNWQTLVTESLNVERVYWGFASSPLALDDLVIVDAGSLAAFDKHTGAVVWKTKAYEAGYGSPVAMIAGDRQLVAVLNNNYLLIVDADDGAEVAWHKQRVSRETSAVTPIIHDDTIFISHGYGDGCVLLRLPGGPLKRVYKNREMSNHMNTCVLWEGYLYGFHGNGNSHPARTAQLVCMEHETGSVQWAERGLGCGSLMIADGKLIVLSDVGELVIIEATPEKQQIISRAKVLDGKCWTVPVLAQGRIYCRNAAGDLVCVDVKRSETQE